MNVILILIGIVLLVGGIGFGVFKIGEDEGGVGAVSIVFGAIVGLAFITFGNSFKIIPTGYTGVQTTFGQISERTMPQGFNWKTPFVSDIKLVNNKIQRVNFDSQIWGESNDKTPVYASDITISYQISSEKSAWLYANISGNFESNLITFDLVQSAIKSAMVDFPYNEVTIRSNIEPRAMEYIVEKLNAKYGEGTIAIIQVVVGQMDFEEAYNNAIQEKSIALQTRERQAIENETKIARAEANKQVAIYEAEAEAERTRIAAEAEAAANELLNSSLTDNILRTKFYDSWDGVLPRVMGQDTVITSIGE